MNGIESKLLLAGEKVMPEMHLWHLDLHIVQCNI